MITNTIQTKMRVNQTKNHPKASTSSYNSISSSFKGHPSPPHNSCRSKLTLLGRLVVVLSGLAVLLLVERDAYRTNTRVLDQTNSTSSTEQQPQSQQPSPNYFSACLVLQNDHENQYLTEWLAYHYHVLPLRRLIVWKDPLSVSNPTAILNKWNTTRMNITLWDQELDIYPVGHPYRKELQASARQGHKTTTAATTTATTATASNSQHHDTMRARNDRQDIFFGACLRRLQREGQSWTMLSHTDEYTLLNPRIRNVSDPLHQQVVQGDNNLMTMIPSQKESGSVLTWLQRARPYQSQPCIPLTSKQFGTKEEVTPQSQNSTSSATANTIPQALVVGETSFSTHDFLTLRWQYWGHPDHHQLAPMVRKSFVDLSRISSSHLHWKVASHRPIPHDSVCPIQRMHEASSQFVVHHYAGTTERLQYDHTHNHDLGYGGGDGNSDNEGIGNGGAAIADTELAHPTTNLQKPLQTMERLHTDTIHNAFPEGNTIPQWLEGFVETVGVENATILLEGVGHVQY